MRKLPRLSSVLCFAALATSAFGDVHLPAILSDHMVLQRTAEVPIWGKADPGEEVTVTLEGQNAKKTKAGENGKWKTTVNLEKSGPGPFTLTVEGKNKLTISDVLVGEVWVASGQSNMEFELTQGMGAAEEIARSANPMFRQFIVPKVALPEPQETLQGEWRAATPETSARFTAVGYYFGKKLQAELKVPVGLINSTWGGTPIETWTSDDAIKNDPDLKPSADRLRAQFVEAPLIKKNYTEGMTKWITEHNRQDKLVQDVSHFTGETVPSEGWTTVTLPGEVKGEGLAAAGAVWLRREVMVETPSATNYSISVPVDGFESIYWNGKLLKQTGYENYPGRGNVRRYGPLDLPPSAVNVGRNVLAIRLYEPVVPATFPSEPKGGGVSLSGTWMAKTEYAFPPLEQSVLDAAPGLPASSPGGQYIASFLFNGMINPIIPYAMRGVIWYQGESNASRAFQYRKAFSMMITDWRKQWHEGDFPFYLCQLANYMAKKPAPGESSWAELREAQSMATALPNTAQAILIDVGEANDIHPRDKQTPGERLAAIALARDYGKKVPYSGPVYDSMKIDGGKVALHFKNTDGGLTAKELPAQYNLSTGKKQTADLVRNSPQSQLEGFAICGEDKQWTWADAKINGDQVVVWSDKVANPVAVRYAWADNPTCNLYNGAGFPASPFRTDDFPASTINGKY